MIRPCVCMLGLLVGSALSLAAQQAANNQSMNVVPQFVKFSGALTDENGKPPTGIVGVTSLSTETSKAEHAAG